MEIIDKTNENQQVGDKVQTDDGRAGIINNTADGKCAIVRTDSEHFGSFSYGLVYDVNPSIEKLQLDNPEFHKTNEYCPCCHGKKAIFSSDGTYEDGYTGVDRYEHMLAYIDGDELIVEHNFEVGYVEQHKKINYCPICGCKLTERN